MPKDAERPIANSAIQYHPDMVDTSRDKLMGRHAAGEGFLDGLVRHGKMDRLYCYAPRAPIYQDFVKRVAAIRSGHPPTTWVQAGNYAQLREAGCLHLAGPGLGAFAWQRRFDDVRGYSICGLTHTTATERVMEALGAFVTSPVQPWDALICTSQAVRSSVEHVLGHWMDYLRERIGGNPQCPAQLEVIPLGVNCDRLAPADQPAIRNRMRTQLGIAEADVAALFLGRLSYHSKAHPLPMFLAAEAAACASGKRVHLILAGWFSSDPVRAHFELTAKQVCPSVNLIYVDGRKTKAREEIWFAADMFVSMSDNIQETFGLTPVEAMAAGLPAVISDWNGYRDTVRNGVDGITIPTLMAPHGSGEILARRFLAEADNYDRYIGQAGLCTAVDVRALSEAMTALVSSEELRKRYGQAGRQRARSAYDWPVIIRAYQELWADLAERRRKGDGLSAPRRANTPGYPLRDDPFNLFASYPTRMLDRSAILECVAADPAKQLEEMMKLDMVHAHASPALLLPVPLIQIIFRTLIDFGPADAGSLTQLYPAARQDAALRTLVWLCKMGILGVMSEQDGKIPASSAPAPAVQHVLE